MKIGPGVIVRCLHNTQIITLHKTKVGNIPKPKKKKRNSVTDGLSIVLHIAVAINLFLLSMNLKVYLATKIE